MKYLTTTEQVAKDRQRWNSKQRMKVKEERAKEAGEQFEILITNESNDCDISKIKLWVKLC